jgi:DNA polymerase-1
VPIEQVTKQQRRVGKTVNFGVIYGISGFGLADRLKIDRKKADEFIAKFYSRYPRVRKFFDDIKAQAVDKGEVQTIMGRKRAAMGMKSKHSQMRAALEREIINFPLQGGAADIMKMAMLKVFDMVKSNDLDIRMHLQVHDEIILSVPDTLSDKKLKSLVQSIEQAMQGVVDLDVPITVNAEIGKNWYDLKAI